MQGTYIVELFDVHCYEMVLNVTSLILRLLSLSLSAGSAPGTKESEDQIDVYKNK